MNNKFKKTLVILLIGLMVVGGTIPSFGIPEVSYADEKVVMEEIGEVEEVTETQSDQILELEEQEENAPPGEVITDDVSPEIEETEEILEEEIASEDIEPAQVEEVLQEEVLEEKPQGESKENTSLDPNANYWTVVQIAHFDGVAFTDIYGTYKDGKVVYDLSYFVNNMGVSNLIVGKHSMSTSGMIKSNGVFVLSEDMVKEHSFKNGILTVDEEINLIQFSAGGASIYDVGTPNELAAHYLIRPLIKKGGPTRSGAQEDLGITSTTVRKVVTDSYASTIVRGKSNISTNKQDNATPGYWTDSKGNTLWCVDPMPIVQYEYTRYISDATSNIGQEKTTKMALVLAWIDSNGGNKLQKSIVSQFYVWRQLAGTILPDNKYSLTSLSSSRMTNSQINSIIANAEAWADTQMGNWIGTAYYYSASNANEKQPMIYFQRKPDVKAYVYAEKLVTARWDSLLSMVDASGDYVFRMTNNDTSASPKYYDITVTVANGQVAGTSAPVQVNKGTYTVTERSVPEGIVRNTDSMTVTVTDANTISNPAKFTFINNQTKWMKIKKVITASDLATLKAAGITGTFQFDIYMPNDEKLTTLSLNLTQEMLDDATTNSITIESGQCPVVMGSGFYAVETAWPEGVTPKSGRTTFDIGSKHTTESPRVVSIKNTVNTVEKEVMVQKDSSNKTLTKGSPCYNMEGIKYNVYDNEACTGAPITSITIDSYVAASSRGTTDTCSLSFGTYWIKEDASSVKGTGYRASNEIQKVEINSESPDVQTVMFTNEPLSDPLNIILKKVSETGSTNGPSLAGARFRIRYYRDIYDTSEEAEANGHTRGWVFETDENGEIKYDEAHLVTSLSAALYANNEGDNEVPPGTYVIKETKAPKGYKLTDDVWVVKLVIPEESTESLMWTILNEKTGEVSLSNTVDANAELDNWAIQVYEPQIFSGVVFDKQDLDFQNYLAKSGDDSISLGDDDNAGENENAGEGNVPHGDATLEGAEITIYNNSGSTIVLKNGTEVADGAACFTLHSDSAGYFDTAELTSDGTGSILPVGTYYAKETKAPTGYKLNTSWRSDFTITDTKPGDGEYIDGTGDLTDEVKKGKVKIIKKDKKNDTAQGNGDLSGIKYAIVNRSANPITVGTTVKPKLIKPGEIAYIVTVGEDGTFERDNVPYGTYDVYELRKGYRTSTVKVTAKWDELGEEDFGTSIYANNAGYLWDGTKQTVTVREDGETKSVTFKNDILRGGVKIHKLSSSESEKSFEGIEFTITNKSTHEVWVNNVKYRPNEVVAKVTVNAEGNYESANTFLPYGTYTVQETKTNGNYELTDGSPRTISIINDGIVVDYDTSNNPLNFTNNPYFGDVKVVKKDKDTVTPQGLAKLEGIRFAVINRSGGKLKVNGVMRNNGEVVTILTLDANGEAKTTGNKLETGSYEIAELRKDASLQVGEKYDTSTNLGSSENANDWYKFDANNHKEFTASKETTYEVEFKNEVVKHEIKVKKSDADSTAPQGSLSGIKYAVIYMSEGSVKISGKTIETGQIAVILTTNVSGEAGTGSVLPAGKYDVVELRQDATITAGETYQGSSKLGTSNMANGSYIYKEQRQSKTLPTGDAALFEFENKMATGYIKVLKKDAENETAQGDASLKGIKFIIVATSNVHVGNSNYVSGQVVSVLTTDANGEAESGALPLATYRIIEVRSDASLAPGDVYENSDKLGESIKANESYLYKTAGGRRTLDENGETEEITFTNTVVKGGVKVVKLDKDLGKVNSGNADFSGIEFTITNKSAKEVKVNGEVYAKGAVVMTITTDAQGNAKTGDKVLPYGTYSIKETKTNGTYKLTDGTARTFKIDENGKLVEKDDRGNALNFENEVVKGKVSVTKKDTNIGTAQGDASFKGIRYAVINDSEGSIKVGGSTFAKGTVVKVLSLNENGKAETANELPYGKYKVVELRKDATIKAGDVYEGSSKLGTSNLANDGYLYKAQVKSDEITSDGDAKEFNFDNAPLKGGVKIEKWDKDLKKKASQGNADFNGVKFEVTNKSTNPVFVNGETYGVNKVVATVTTNAAGDGSLGKILPYGTYEIKEVKTNDGYKLTDGTPKTFTIRENGEVVDKDIKGNLLKFENEVVKGKASVTKFDANIGTAQGDATFKGIRYAVINKSNKSIKVGETNIESGAVVKILTLNEKGKAETAKELPYGAYDVVELRKDATIKVGEVYEGSTKLGTSILANDGYLFKEQKESITITSESENKEVSFKNEPVKGGAKVEKWDSELKRKAAQGDADFAGIKFEITNESKNSVYVSGKTYEKGKVVATITVNKSGDGSIGKVLPYGTYSIKEIETNGSYLLTDGTVRTFTIRENGEVADAAAGKPFENEVVKGSLEIIKVSTELSKANHGDATPEGIRFAVVNKSAKVVKYNGEEFEPGKVIDILTLDKDGKAKTEKKSMPYGTYGVYELRMNATIKTGEVYEGNKNLGTSILANDGYLFKANAEEISVRTDGEEFKAEFDNETVKGNAHIKKSDAETIKEQGDAKFTGIRYAVVNRSKAPVKVAGNEYEAGKVVGIITLNDKGEGTVKNLPYGTYEVTELRLDSELKVGDTYKADGKSIYANENGYLYKEYSETKEVRVNGETVEFANSDYVVRGGVKLGKIDRETSENSAQGIATLKGAEFTIYNNSAESVLANGKVCAKDEAVKVIVTNEEGFAETDARDLSYGTYYAKETKAPTGYVLNEEYRVDFRIREDGKVIDATTEEMAEGNNGGWFKVTGANSDNPAEVADQIKRMDLKFSKVDIDGYRMAGIPFLISRLDADGNIVEQHVVITDENGEVDTSRLNKEGDKVNSLDQYVSGGKYEGPYDSTVGVWFGEQSAKDNSLGSMIYAQYKIEELSCSNNKDIDLLKTFMFADSDNKEDFKDVYFVHGEARDLANVLVNLLIKPSSDLVDSATGTKLVTRGESVKVTDTFKYIHTKIDQDYKLKTEIIYIGRDGETRSLGENTISFRPIKSDNTRTAYGEVKNTVTVNTKDLVGGSLAAVDTLYGLINGEYVELTVHNANLNVESQMLYIPYMETFASDARTNDHVGTVEAEAEIIDKVKYENLGHEKMYLFVGELKEAETGEAVIGTDGNPVRVEKFLRVNWNITEVKDRLYGSLGPKDGEIEMPAFKFDSTKYAGKTIVVTETLYDYDTDEVVLTHDKLTDENQSVHYPEVTTEATDVNTETRTAVVGKTVIKDKVTIKNAVPGMTYVVTGDLVYKEDCTDSEGTMHKKGEVLSTHEPVKVKATGKTVVITLEYEVDASKLEGTSAVVFEDVLHKDIVVATHHDYDAESQTPNWPKVRTYAVDPKTKSNVGTVEKKAVITDTVLLTNLTVGDSYKVIGKLMMSDGTEYGKTLESEVFTATERDMTKVLSFEVDSTKLAGKSLIVFEKLIHVGEKEVEVARHEDLEDKNQTINYPHIKTNAKDASTDDQVGKVGSEETIIDVVTYTNLTVGETYTIEGTLHYKEDGNGHKAGDVVKENGNPITSSVTFNAETKNGTVNLVYHINSELLRGESIVVFEDVLHNDILIYSHADINDDDQRIDYPEVKTTAISKKTGDHVGDTDKETVIIDIVELKNLKVGETYEVKGILMDKETGEPVPNVKTEPVTFTAEESDMTVDITFTLSGKDRENRTTVAFEELIHNNVVVVSHKDLEDGNQTVWTPSVITEAKDEETGANVGRAREETVIVDKITLKNLIKGREYTITGYLMDQSTNEKYIDAYGKEVMGTPITFRATKSTEVKEMTFKFNGSNLKGKTVTVFEDLYHNDVIVAAHRDINSVPQSVDYPDGYTEAKDAVTNTHMVLADSKATVIDTMYYSNLRPGIKYVAKGTLMNKKTGEPILENGQPVTGKTEFTPLAKDGEVKIEFNFNAGLLKGEELVVFEDVLYNDIEVIVHHNIEDEKQTVVVPEIGTKLTADGKKEVMPSKRTTLVDTVSYSNLIPGKTYTMSGELVNKSTKEVVSKAEAKFVASETGSGTVEITFKADTSKLAGKSVVAFETCTYEENGTVYKVAEHKDINDKDQTIVIKNIGKITVNNPNLPRTPRSGLNLPKTGDFTNIAGWIVLFMASLFVIIVFVITRRKNLSKESK